MSIVVGYPTYGTPLNPAKSPQELQNRGFRDGYYSMYDTTSEQTQAVIMYVFMNLIDSKAWAVGFASSYASTAEVNNINYKIPWTGLAVRRVSTTSLTNRSSNVGPETAYFDETRKFDTDDSTVESNGLGTRVGYRVYLGYAGGHGIYTTSQDVCSWGLTTSGAIGAGYDGSTCGTFPNALRWGTGPGGTATYDNRSGYWQILIHWE
jgi:hypothetical protein